MILLSKEKSKKYPSLSRLIVEVVWDDLLYLFQPSGPYFLLSPYYPCISKQNLEIQGVAKSQMQAQRRLFLQLLSFLVLEMSSVMSGNEQFKGLITGIITSSKFFSKFDLNHYFCAPL
jgi:hypothetical protein